jgi:starch phosphorylase
MRVLDNVDLPASIQSLLPPKPVKKTLKAATNGASDGKAVNGNGVGAVNGVEEEVVVAQRPAATVRMANLCVIAGHKVNGVAAIHSQIVVDEVFNDFYKVRDIFSKEKNMICLTSRPYVRAWYVELVTLIFKIMVLRCSSGLRSSRTRPTE